MNYKVAYDGQTKYKPPSYHSIPSYNSIPTKSKQKPKQQPVTNSQHKSGNARFISVQSLDEDALAATKLQKMQSFGAPEEEPEVDEFAERQHSIKQLKVNKKSVMDINQRCVTYMNSRKRPYIDMDHSLGTAEYRNANFDYVQKMLRDMQEVHYNALPSMVDVAH